jgi:Domain of unknown function (DUF1929)/F5/8 type C domain
MKVSAPAAPKYLFAALFLVAVVLLVLPGSALVSDAAKNPTVAIQSSTNPAVVGKWNPTLIPFKTVPLHISLLPNGKILYWGRDKVMNGPNLEDVTGQSNTYVVDPQFFFNDPLAVGHTTTYTNITTNLFCSGHSFLPDGRLVVTGGHEKNSSFPFTEGLGDRSVNLFDYTNTTSPWSRLTTGLTWGRWYPYNVTLASGDVAVLGGSYWTNRSTPGSQPISNLNPSPEKYIFDPNGKGSIGVYQQDQNPFAPPDVYPLLHLLGDGRILVTGVGSRLFDPNDPNLIGHFVGYPFGFSGPIPGQSKYNGSSALYDVASGKVLVMGGTPGIGGTPVSGAVSADTSILSDWQSAGAMAFKRKFHTATILPDGKVLVSGGTQCTGGNNVTCTDFPTPTSGAAVITPELWSQSSPTVWNTMAASPSAIPRVYHSIALLLPDATVLVGGGGLPGALGEPGAGTDTNSPQFRGYGHPDAEIFSPPYLFDSFGNPAVRPVITSVQANKIGLGQAMQVGFSSSTAISSVVLIRLGSVTHGTNQDQRRIPLNFSASGSNLSVTMPATGQVCPPGPYMLFILNANGTPSVAKIITVSTTPQVLNGDTVWVEDSLPAGAIPDGISEGWNWVSTNPPPFSGALANQSNIVAGLHQHFFSGATETLTINTGDKLMAYVYIDPANLPSEIMLQWNDGTWEHRAYWGANFISWGVDGTNSRRFMGPLPAAGQWVRLEVPANLVGLEGRTLNGLAFSMYGGRATWDRAGKTTGTTTTPKNVAAAANGAFATASSTVTSNFPASAAINGDRAGNTWGTPTGGWADGSEGVYSQDWVRVDFNGTKTISEIDVYTLRDGYASQSTDPTLTETFNTALNTGQGITSYDVQYLSGSGWVTIDCGNPASPCGRVSNNNKVRRQFIFSPVQTSAVRVAVHGAVPFSFANNYSRLVEVEAYSSLSGTNLALGRTATQSSTLYTSAAAAVDGNRDGNFANASVTHTSNTAQPWWQVDLSSSQTLDSIKLWNRTDCCGDRLSNFYVLVSDQPFSSTDLMTTLGQPGVTGYYTPGQAGPSISINVGRTARYVRVQLAGTNFLSLAEVEIFGSGKLNVAQTVTGSSLPRATASSTFSASYPVSAVIDGDRQGRNWGNGGGWNDATEGQFGSDWLQVNFAGTRTINEIDVYTLRDAYASQTGNPTLTEIFNTAPNTGFGITSFTVQYLSGGSWVDIPNGPVVSNNNVWRRFTFSPISTSAIRVVVRDAVLWTSAPNNYSRIVEVEAWEP